MDVSPEVKVSWGEAEEVIGKGESIYIVEKLEYLLGHWVLARLQLIINFLD